jgi:hypothetical protein
MSGESPLGSSEGIISYCAICTRKGELTREAAGRFLHGIRIRLAHATNGRFRKVHFAICMTGNGWTKSYAVPIRTSGIAAKRTAGFVGRMTEKVECAIERPLSATSRYARSWSVGAGLPNHGLLATKRVKGRVSAFVGQLQHRRELRVAAIIAKNMSSKEAFRLGKCCIFLACAILRA